MFNETEMAIPSPQPEVIEIATPEMPPKSSWNIKPRAITALAIVLAMDIYAIAEGGVHISLSMLGFDVCIYLTLLLVFLVGRSVGRGAEAGIKRRELEDQSVARFFRENGFHGIQSISDEVKNSWSLTTDPTGEDANMIAQTFSDARSMTNSAHPITFFRQIKTYKNKNGSYTKKRWVATIDYKGSLPDIFLFDPKMGDSNPRAFKLTMPPDVMTRYSLHANRAYGNEVYEFLTKDLLEFIDTDTTPHHVECIDSSIIITLAMDLPIDTELPELIATLKLARGITTRFGDSLDRAKYITIGDISPVLPAHHSFGALIVFVIGIIFVIISNINSSGPINIGAEILNLVPFTLPLLILLYKFKRQINESVRKYAPEK